MSNAPSSLSPRQRMINMMYLVLTALLALNVSKEVLNAFHSVNYGLKSTNESTVVTNQQVYIQFEDIALRNPEKNGPWKDRAFTVKNNIGELQALIKEIKFQLVANADGKIHFIGEVDEEGDEIGFSIKDITYEDFIKKYPHLINKKIGYVKDGKTRVVMDEKNTSIAWNLLRDDKPKQPEEYFFGPQLRDNINDLKKMLLSETQDYDNNKDGIQPLLEDKSLRQEIAKILSTKIIGVKEKKFGSGKADSTWLATKFRAMPVVAAFTMLTQLESDLLKIESDVIKHLLKTIDADAITMTGGKAMVMPRSNYVFSGDEYNADIFFGLKDKFQNPTIYFTDNMGNIKDNGDGTYNCVGCDSLPIIGGVGKLNRETKRVGVYEYGGLMKISTDITDKYYPFGPIEYRVAKKSVVVSPTRMNTLYILCTRSEIKSGKINDKNGNPIEVSAAGFAPEDLSIACYEMNKVDGKYKISDKKVKYRKKGKGKYFVYPTRVGKVVIKVIGKDENGRSKTQDVKEFYVKRPPPPTVVLKGTTSKDDKKIKKKNALSAVAVFKTGLPDDFPFKGLNSRVTGFTFESTGGQMIKKVDVIGSSLSRGKRGGSEVAKYIDEMSPGDKFTITNIMVKGPDGRESPWAGDLVYTIAR